MRQYPGRLITCEGIDGVGKTSQAKLLATALHDAGFHVHRTKEPGDGKLGSKVGTGVRSLLFNDPGTAKLAPGVGDLLFLADHVQNVEDIKEHIDAGHIVISDRYADSQVAYSAAPGKRTPDWASKLYTEMYGILPDITLLFVARGKIPVTPYLTVGALGFDQIQANEDISWALHRANNRSSKEIAKQAGKGWNLEDEQRKIQREYIMRLTFQPRVICIHVWEHSTIGDVHKTVLRMVLDRLPIISKEG